MSLTRSRLTSPTRRHDKRGHRIIVVRHHARSALVRASDRSLRQVQRTPRCAVVASAAFACWLTTSMSMTVRILGARHRG